MFRPLSDLVIVRPDGKQTQIGRIILAESAQEEAKQGTVLAAGPGKLRENGKFEPMMVQVGERVLFSEFAKEKFKYQGENLIIMHDDDILGVIDD